jgi:hypothetical protein
MHVQLLDRVADRVHEQNAPFLFEYMGIKRDIRPSGDYADSEDHYPPHDFGQEQPERRRDDDEAEAEAEMTEAREESAERPEAQDTAPPAAGEAKATTPPPAEVSAEAAEPEGGQDETEQGEVKGDGDDVRRGSEMDVEPSAAAPTGSDE